MGRILKLTNKKDVFTQGLSSNNVGIEIHAYKGNDEIHLNRSDDLGGRSSVYGGSGHDYVDSFREDGNVISLGKGNDTYVGNGFGSFSSDRADTVLGGSGADTFAFSTFKSEYYGGSGNDVFHSVGQQNFVDGGTGSDTISYAPRADDSVVGNTGVTINLATQKVATGALRTETLVSIENAIGSDNSDQLIGSAGANKLQGGGGIDGMVGGGGADVFIYARVADAPINAELADEVGDFSRSVGDKIDLSGIDAKSGVAGNQRFTFIGTEEFSHRKGELRYVENAAHQQLVQGDKNGDGAADFQFLVTGVDALHASDFFL